MKRKLSKTLHLHKCCGQRIRARVIDGQLVQVPHQCSDASDVAGIDWTKPRNEWKWTA